MSPRLYVFDVDRTLLKHNCSFRFYYHLLKQGYFSFHSLLLSISYYIRFRFLGMPLFTLHEKVFQHFLEGQSYSFLREEGRSFLNECLEQMLYEPCLAHLKKAMEKGDYILLLSSSPDFMIEPIAEVLQVHEWEATKYSLDENSCLESIFHLIGGVEKVQRAQQVSERLNISHRNIVAYSDSISDLPLMEFAGKAIAVNPDRKLKKIAEKRDWEIL